MSALQFRRAEPSCPFCNVVLTVSELQDGVVNCSRCGNPFEATALHPVTRTLHVAEVAAAGPETAAACANHARNAAAAHCQRCGLLICALCDMNTGGGSFCPACFERLRVDKSVPGAAIRYADYASLARLTVILGVPMISLGLFVGSAGAFFAYLGFKQRKREGRSRVGVVILMLLALAEVAVGAAIILIMVWAMVQAAKR